MSNVHPHDLHQVIRSWLLAEDPYGMNNRIEPTFGNAAPPTAPSSAAADPRAAEAGGQAVDSEMDKVNTEQWRGKMEGRKAERARAGSEGKAAVADAVSPKNVRNMIAERANQPAWASPEESATVAQSLGPRAVENALHAPNNPPGFLGPANPSTMPMTPPGQSFGPQAEDTTPGYAPSEKRAGHYGRNAVERELLDKQPE